MKTESKTELIDVLVVGGGPTGTALAIDLTRRGLAVRIIDKAAKSFDGSRAKGIQPRSLEVLEDLGVLEDIRVGGGEYPLLGIHAGPLTIPWHMVSHNELTSDVPHPNTWLIPQFRTDAALRAGLRRLGVSVESKRELVGFEQRRDAVVATVAGGDGVEEIGARYLVGADGGASTVRKTADIGFEGSTDESDRRSIAVAVHHYFSSPHAGRPDSRPGVDSKAMGVHWLSTPESMKAIRRCRAEAPDATRQGSASGATARSSPTAAARRRSWRSGTETCSPPSNCRSPR
ncbi:FAD-dependent monooxygenase [Nocardia amamiensis]|uniref:FAD-dependent monooxygenase n=1 Tax=Nocardia TaxID=1817 RepID=UPI0033C8D3F9